MTDYYRDCRYCEVEAGEDHKEDCPLYNPPSEKSADFSKVNHLDIGYD